MYQLALDYQLIADQMVDSLPSGRGYLRTPIRKCANSMPSHIAEGTGERGQKRARFYRIAPREGLESASHLSSCRKLSLGNTELLLKGRQLLHRIIGMMTKLVRRAESDGRASRSEKRRKKKRETVKPEPASLHLRVIPFSFTVLRFSIVRSTERDQGVLCVNPNPTKQNRARGWHR